MVEKKERKPRKRGHGEGTIYQRWTGRVTVNGKPVTVYAKSSEEIHQKLSDLGIDSSKASISMRWVAQVPKGNDPGTGERIRPTFYGKTRAEVAEKLTKALREIQTGTYTDSDKITLGEWLDVWVETYAKPSIRPSTFDLYKQLIKTHIKPGLGKVPLQKLQPHQIQKFYNDRLRAKRQPRTMPKDKKKAKELMEKMPTLSHSTVKQMHIVLNQALNQAMKERRILVNPTKAAKPPKVTRPEAAYLNKEQIKNLLGVASEDSWYTVFFFTLGTGMRLGEVCALRWENIDLVNGVVKVRESVKRVSNDVPEEQKTKLLIQPPKSEKGKRNIPLPNEVLAELKKHRVKQAELKLQIGELYNDQDLVFAWEDGRMVDPGYLSKHFKKVINQCGYEGITFHSLRHSYASALLTMGEHPKVVQELLGHAQISMTLDTYSHVAPEIKERAAAKMNEFLDMKKPSQEKEG